MLVIAPLHKKGLDVVLSEDEKTTHASNRTR